MMEQKQVLRNVQSTTQSHIQTNDYWDGRLTATDKQPFPLAPRDWVERGLVTPRIYRKQNIDWGDFVTNIMVNEPPLGNVSILGAGLTRDLGWIPRKVQCNH